MRSGSSRRRRRWRRRARGLGESRPRAPAPRGIRRGVGADREGGGAVARIERSGAAAGAAGDFARPARAGHRAPPPRGRSRPHRLARALRARRGNRTRGRIGTRTPRRSSSSSRSCSGGLTTWRRCSSAPGSRPSAATRRRSATRPCGSTVCRPDGHLLRRNSFARSARPLTRATSADAARSVAFLRNVLVRVHGFPRKPGAGPYADRADRGAVRPFRAAAAAVSEPVTRRRRPDVHARAAARRRIGGSVAFAVSLDGAARRCRSRLTTARSA